LLQTNLNYENIGDLILTREGLNSL